MSNMSGFLPNKPGTRLTQDQPSDGPSDSPVAVPASALSSISSSPSIISFEPSMAVQLIDENKQFNPRLLDYFRSIGMESYGLNYHIVSVFGSQSTGKSTLLNALFGTSFDVMNESQRRQTTRGIWMAKSQIPSELLSHGIDELIKPVDSPSTGGSSPDISSVKSSSPQASISSFVNISPSSTSNVIVLDVEGTDGRERGEDQDFERKAALFALATSEVLIVNMWENQVGLYQGANMGLLKTVFEVNLSLFHGSSTSSSGNRSLILFVIRDHIGTTPLANLEATVTADLNRIWEGLTKPASLEDKGSKFTDFFDLQFHTLPHKILLPDQFAAQVSVLAQRFTHPHNSSYVFQPQYHRGVPIDGWNMYAEKIWEQIELNKDLDLPTQQILVARFRCEEIAAQAWQQFETGLGEAQKEAENAFGNSTKVVPNFGPTISSIRKGTLDIYDSLASRYAKAVYAAKRDELLSRIDTRIGVLFKAQIAALHKTALTNFASSIEGARKTGNIPFMKALTQARTDVAGYFTTNIEASNVDKQAFHHANELEQFNLELDAISDKFKIEEIQRITQKVIKRIQTVLSNELESYFRSPNEDTWDSVYNFFKSTIDGSLRLYCQSATDFGVEASREENQKGFDKIHREAWYALDNKLNEITKDDNILLRLRESFEDHFRYDKQGVPIVWKATDDIETPYVAARDEALNLLPIFATARLSTGKYIIPDTVDDEDAEILSAASFSERISSSRQQDISARFKRQADNIFLDAKRSTTQSATHIPWFIFVLIVLLGFNEFMAVLRNPLLIMLILMLSAGAYVAFSLNLWGPMLSVSSAMADRSLEIAKDKLRDFLEVPVEPKKVPVAVAVSAETYEEIPLQNLEVKDHSDINDS